MSFITVLGVTPIILLESLALIISAPSMWRIKISVLAVKSTKSS